MIQRAAWLLERTGFELPRPVDFAARQHGLSRLCGDWLRRNEAIQMATSFDNDVGVSTKPSGEVLLA